MSESVDGIPHMGQTKVTLGDIARNISENEYKPKEKGLDRCVGLEHLDPGSLKVQRWSPITPEMSFTRRFYTGQILFGKRRAYQKKVALADFDGICSSDILVIEAKNENIVPELLPFIIQDDRFFEFAVGTSSGSLSPRTKWKFLSEYEIWLPPLDEQRRIGTTLWAAEDCIVKGERFVSAAERAKQVLMAELFRKGIGHSEFKEIEGLGLVPKEWEICYFSDLAGFKNGVNFDKGSLGKGVKIIGVADFQDYLYPDYRNIQEINPEGVVRTEDLLLENDILFVRSNGNPDLIGRNLLIKNLNEKMTHSGFTIRARLFDKQKSNPIFYSQLFKTDIIRRLISNHGGGTNISNLSQAILSNILVTTPSYEEQRQIVTILTRCDETIAAARANVATTKVLKMKMINELLSPPVVLNSQKENV